MLSQDFFLRGMNNMYNSVGFAILDHCDFFDETTRWQDTYNVKEKEYFSTPMQYMIQEYLMGGAMITKKASELINGFNSTASFMINGGDFF